MQAHSSHGIRVDDDVAEHTATLTPQNQFLTHAFADQLRTQFGDILQGRLSGDFHHILVDLENVLEVDSSGLALLLGLKKRAEAAGTTFRLTGLTPPVRRMIKLANAARALGV